MGSESKESQSKRFFIICLITRYTQTLFILLGIILILIAALIKFKYPQQTFLWVAPLSEALIGIAGVLFSTGLLSVYFEKKIQEQRMEEFEKLLQQSVLQTKDHVDGSLSTFQKKLAEFHVDDIIGKHVEILEGLKKHDFVQEMHKKKVMPIMERQHLEISAFNFEKLTRRLMSCSSKPPVLIYGTTLSFLKRGNNREVFAEALREGVHFKFALADVNRYHWDTKDQNDIKKDSRFSLELIIEILKNDLTDKDAQDLIKGSVDLRTTHLIATNSFSSFKFENERVSVFEFNIDIHGRANNPRYSQIFEHEEDLNTGQELDNNLAGRLVGLYSDLHEKSIHALTFPKRRYHVHMYGIEPGPGIDNILFLEKEGEWTLPNAVIESDTIIPTIAREKYRQLTGYDILFLRTLNVLAPHSNGNDIVFIGKVTSLIKDAQFPKINVKGFKFDDLPLHPSMKMMGAIGREELRRICEHP